MTNIYKFLYQKIPYSLQVKNVHVNCVRMERPSSVSGQKSSAHAPVLMMCLKRWRLMEAVIVVVTVGRAKWV